MCLVTTMKEPKTAERDITVFKVLLCAEGKYYAPYFKEYEFKEGENLPIGDTIIVDHKFSDGTELRHVYGGYLHSVVSTMEGLSVFGNLTANIAFKKIEERFSVVLVEMTIPKGAKYYESEDGLKLCSDKLVWNWPFKPYFEWLFVQRYNGELGVHENVRLGLAKVKQFQ